MSSDAETGGNPKADGEGRAALARRFFFGDDVFVSYARRDAADYALALASELTKRGLSCFLDQWGTPPGSRLPDSLKTALRQSTMLVLVGTERAAASENVREEVVEFLKTGRTIIPITFSSRGTGTARDAKESLNGTLEQATWYDLIRGTSVTVESLEALEAVAPSPTVVDRIVHARGFTRRNQRLRQVFWSTLSAIVVLLIAGGTGSAILLRQAAAAKKDRDDAIVEEANFKKAAKAAKASQSKAELLERRSMSERLAAVSVARAETHPQLALGLAVEAVNVIRNAGDRHVADADEALRNALAGIGGVPLTDFHGDADGIASSRDGLRFFSIGSGATAHAWDLSQGRPARSSTLRGPGRSFLGLDLSPDDRQLIATGASAATLWEFARPDPTPRPVELPDKSRIAQAIFTPDGRRVLLVGEGGTTAWLWDPRAEGPAAAPSRLCGLTPAMINDLMKSPEARADPIGTLRARVVRVAWNDDGRLVVASNSRSDPKLFDLSKDDPTAAAMTLAGFPHEVADLETSKDGRRIAVVQWSPDGSGPGRVVGVWTLDASGALDGPPRLFDHPGRIEAMALSLDGRWLATGNADQMARLWDLSAPPDAKPKLLKGHAGEIWAVAFSPDGRWLATGSDSANDLGRDSLGKYLVQLWDLKPTPRPGLGGPLPAPGDVSSHLSTSRGPVLGHVRHLIFSPDNHWLAASTIGIGGQTDARERVAYLWRMNDEPPELKTYATATGPLLNLALHGHEGRLDGVRFTRDGRRLATAGSDGTARVWDLEAEAWAAAPISLSADGYAPRVLMRGRWLVTVGETVRLWDLASPLTKAGGDVLTTYRGQEPVAALDDRGRRLATASSSKDGTQFELRLFDLTSSRPVDRPIALAGHAKPIDRIAIDADGRRMATSGTDGTVLAWDLAASPPVAKATLPGLGVAIDHLALSRDGRRLATVAKGHAEARLYDLDAAKPADQAASLDGQGGPISQILFDPGGRWLASRSSDGLARLWPLAGEGPRRARSAIVLNRPERVLGFLEISPDGRWLVTHESRKPAAPGKDQDIYQIRLWDLTVADPSTSPLAWPFASPTDQGFGFTPDGRAMLTSLTRSEITAAESIVDPPLRDVPFRQAAAIRDLSGKDPKSNPPRVLDFGLGSGRVSLRPDGRWLLSGRHLLELGDEADPTAINLPVLGRNANPEARSIGFSPDGRWAIVGADDRIELHPLGMDELIALARRTASRNLTPLEWKLYLPDLPLRKTFPDLP